MSFLKGAGDILGTISPALGAITGKGLGAGMMPMISPLGALLGLGKSGGGKSEEPAPNPMATGLGKLIGADGSRVSEIAGRIGGGMNQIASAGGAAPGYAAPQAPQELPNNHLQMLDPNVLRALIQRFGGRQGQI